ncbi:hypothetical protein [Candidatus Bandiella euplotis]|uniref:DNA-protecting protein DprA domain protein n=1 Tax=Candidatus Bandiella euplotis TaxID=1664265 RepID=A0ABZ0UKH0_9RICK|nr:hypothetical protein [Candidatus Bandiella woodruffii]WPX96621.1 Putative DNA-protecting protein DprA domain protein [Candidatus Bandiella woodruffii]
MGSATDKSKSESFRLSWLRLARTKNVGAKTFIELMNLYGDPQLALENVDVLAKKGGAKGDKLVPSIAVIEKEILETEKHGAKIGSVLKRIGKKKRM